jgi:RNA polymerase sigma-54 factor
MDLVLKPTQILTHQLIMTPQLQQAIKLLQLSRMEMVEQIQQELGENPALEAMPESENEINIHNVAEWHQYLDSDNYHKKHGSGFEAKESVSFETYTPTETSLAEYLLWQLLMTLSTPEDEKIGSFIVGSLDDKGYLKSSIEEIAAMSDTEPQRVNQVLTLMQSFDPAGVCARDLEECFLIQAHSLGHEDTIVSDIILNHLNDIGKRDYKAIGRTLRVSVEVVISAVNIIKGLEPIPARQFSGNKALYIVPDIFVYKKEGSFVIELNNSGMPRLCISSYYKNILANGASTKETKAYLQDKMRSAEWLIKSIYQRKKTICHVMESILKFQHDFFENGASHLKPMILRDVAQDIDRSESTISRITTNKYVQTAHGIFELKYFFSSFIQRSDGESMSSKVVQEKIRKIVAGEDPQKPLSDNKITKILNDSNINIARRTVAKYRESLKILPSSRRKKYTPHLK